MRAACGEAALHRGGHDAFAYRCGGSTGWLDCDAGRFPVSRLTARAGAARASTKTRASVGAGGGSVKATSGQAGRMNRRAAIRRGFAGKIVRLSDAPDNPCGIEREAVRLAIRSGFSELTVVHVVRNRKASAAAGAARGCAQKRSFSLEIRMIDVAQPIFDCPLQTVFDDRDNPLRHIRSDHEYCPIVCGHRRMAVDGALVSVCPEGDGFPPCNGRESTDVVVLHSANATGIEAVLVKQPAATKSRSCISHLFRNRHRAASAAGALTGAAVCGPNRGGIGGSSGSSGGSGGC
ncbi:hypothetical protein BURCE16_08335 [Burkholderia cepacia]|nr:hypothetical protein BURCE16_08335 [Burkholderia cepacia]